MRLIDRCRKFLQNTGIGKRVVLLLLLAVFFWLVWIVRIQHITAYEDVVTASEDGRVTMPFEKVTGFEILVRDPSQEKIIRDPLELTLVITSEDGDVLWTGSYADIKLDMGYFTVVADDFRVPFYLGVGTTYYVKCYYPPGDQLENINIRIYGEKQGFGGIYFFFAAFSMITIGIVLFESMRKRKIPLERLAFILIVMTGLLYYIVLPPFSGLDEKFHFVQSYALTEKWSGENIEGQSYLDMPEEFNTLRYAPTKQTFYSFYDHLFDETTLTDKQTFGASKVNHNLPFYIYFVQGLGVGLARILHLNCSWMLVLGRLFNLLLTAALYALALKIIPFGKRTMFVFYMIPMNLNIIGTFSYDALNLSLCVLFFSLCMSFAYRKKAMGWKEIALLSVIGALMAPIKMVYIIFLVFALFIPAKKYKSDIQWIAGNAVMWMSSIAAIAVSRMGEIKSTLMAASESIKMMPSAQEMLTVSVKGTVDVASALSAAGAEGVARAAAMANRPIVNAAASTFYSLDWALNHFGETITIFINTFFERGDSYFLTAFGNRYADITVPSFLIFIVAGMFFFSCATEKKIPRFSGTMKVFTGIIGFVMLILLMTSMFFGYTNMGGEVIEGVQGRYLLPFFGGFLILLQNRKIRLKEDYTYHFISGMVLMNIWITLEVFCQTLRL